MKKLLPISLFFVLGLSLGNWQLLPFRGKAEPTSDEAKAASSQEQESSEKSEKVTPETQGKKQQQKDTLSPASGVAGLKKTTDPETLLQTRGLLPGENRNDPFKLFPAPPKEVVRADPPSPTPAELPTQEPAPPPEPPKPELARAVQVQGAVQIGNQVTAILKAPNEETSRYVRPGQLIANNQVLVKQINIDEQSVPTVVLKELGIEEDVIKPLEEGATAGATSTETPAGQLPSLPPPPS